MAWFVLARVLFVAAVGYSACQLQPLRAAIVSTSAFGLAARRCRRRASKSG